MSAPSTPQKQIQLEQLASPPGTAGTGKETTSITTHQHHESGAYIRRLTYNPRVTPEIEKEDESSDLASCGNHVKQHRDTQCLPEPNQTQHSQVGPEQNIEKPVARLQFEKQEAEGKSPDPQRNQDNPEEAQDQQAAATQQSEGTLRQHDTGGQPKGEVARWLYSSATPEQRRQRFNSLLHGLWPSNDKFNSARNPFYDSEEDGPYEFFLCENWDGHCPYYDDDYNIFTDPSKSTEVWQPKIGEEGIENEQDLRMVLKARQEHKDRSEAFKKRKYHVVKTQMQAGIEYADVDMLQVFLSPKRQSHASDSDYNKKGKEIPKLTIQIPPVATDSPAPKRQLHASDSDYNKQGKERPKLTLQIPPVATDSPAPGKSTLKHTIAAKGIRVFGSQEPSSRRGRPKGSKNKTHRGHKSNKRGRGPNDNLDRTYKHDSGFEDEQPLRKKPKKGKVAAGEDVAGDPVWRAQTRAAARRGQHGGMDGTCEDDNENSTEAAVENGFIEDNEDSEDSRLRETGDLLSHLASLISATDNGAQH
ncbi:hypothetical protein F4859DRAFT_509224 [Xylaria cf. heliscus]|nr:hypothetical protein F4859DRAFT_509224 [Xylaria cf. heliscus]